MATLCRRSSSHQLGSITRHARYAIISPARMPSCLSLLAISLQFTVMIVIGGIFQPALLRWLHFLRSNRWRAVGRLTGWRWQDWLRRRRHRLLQRYDSIPSNRLSNLRHGLTLRFA